MAKPFARSRWRRSSAIPISRGSGSTKRDSRSWRRPSAPRASCNLSCYDITRPATAPLRGTGPANGAVAENRAAQYQLIAGERRWLAAKKAGLKTVPAIVRQCSNEQAMELAIVENLQREDLNPLEQAMAFDRLGREFGLTQEQMAQKTGKDRTSISNYVRLLRLPVETQSAITLGQLSMGHAKVLMALESRDLIVDVTKRVLDQALSVRQTEEVVDQMLNPPEKEPKTPKAVDPNVREAERRLEQVLGTRVRIKDRKGRGRVVIEYHTLDDFDRIVEALGAGK